ncbi:aspartate/glutamate racemase family protein [Flagellimonas marina]|uniref:Aspartate/glutamate racemase family protein n=1 Tax=Flagellimonas marina TaxID=1775168 RepID=A0ABV8PQ01_9FLAO
MRHIGIIGGIGPESTIAYYRSIIKVFQEKQGMDSYPELTLRSIDLIRMLGMANSGNLEELTKYLKSHLEILKSAGAEYVALASNTPHVVSERLAQIIEIPIIDIAEETCKFISNANIKRVGLLGTKSTMNAGFYQMAGKKHGIEIVTPHSKAQDFVHEKYLSEIIFNHIVPDTKEKFREIMEELKHKEKIDGIIIGGTELPFIMRQEEFHDIELFDTTQIHVTSIVNKIIEG